MHFLGWWQLDTAFAENRTHHGSCFLFHLSFILCMQRFWTWAYVFLPFADHGQASCVWWWRFEGQIAQCESRQSEQGDHWELSARTQTCGLVAWILLLFFSQHSGLFELRQLRGQHTPGSELTWNVLSGSYIRVPKAWKEGLSPGLFGCLLGKHLWHGGLTLKKTF